MVIQPITTQYYQPLVELYLELERFYFKDQAIDSREHIEDYIVNKMLAPWSGVQVVGAIEGETMLGFATFSILFPAPRLTGQLFMKDLFVSEKARGKQVGQQLMRYLANFALEHDCNRFDWTAETTNPNAITYYQHLGAELVEDKRYFRFSGVSLREFAAK